MQVARNKYVIFTNQPKQNGQKPNPQDLINVGYMAGRFGVSLDGNLQENKIPQITPNGTLIDINSCTSELLEKNLNQMGMKFNKLA